MSGLIRYCEIPTRFAKSPEWQKLRENIQQIVRSWGDAPVIPFDVGPYDDFEGNPKLGDYEMRRGRTLKLMVHLKNGCDADAIFGISEGTMIELKDTLDRRDKQGIERDVRVYYGLDPDWEKYYALYKQKYGDLFARLRGPNTLIALVGPRAIGKTFWSERLLRMFYWKLQRVKNTTTRDVRKTTKKEEKRDRESYNFVSREEFEEGIRENRFLEYDQYQGNYYGSSIEEIKKVLKKKSGIFAITPAGAKALYERRFEINLKILRLVPRTEQVLKENLKKRDINDPDEQRKLLDEAKTFALPDEIEHNIISLSRDMNIDEKGILSIVNLILNKKTAH